jgi:aspartate-semialdehyde dehydrogenase
MTNGGQLAMSTKKWNVAVVGALGLVGTEMLKTLEQRSFPVDEMRPLDIAAKAGTEITYAGRKIRTRTANADNFVGGDIAIFSAGAAASKELAPLAVEKGCVVVDNSSAWRMDPECPLVVPEVNPHDLRWHKGIIANPNCSTIQMVVVLKPLHDVSRIKRLVISTYQAASGAGQAGLAEVQQQTKAIVEGSEPAAPKAFSCQLAFNAIPQVDVFEEGDYTKEEWKMVHETRKILGDDSMAITATCVRIPVLVSHSESVNVQTEAKITPKQARELLRDAPGVVLLDDPSALQYPVPADAAGTDAVFVGRIREDFSIANGLNLWIVADNVRKGAALNAVQIAERLVADDLVRV